MELALIGSVLWHHRCPSYRSWSFFFVVIGMNAITIYVAKNIIDFAKISRYFLTGVANLSGPWKDSLLQLAHSSSFGCSSTISIGKRSSSACSAESCARDERANSVERLYPEALTFRDSRPCGQSNPSQRYRRSAEQGRASACCSNKGHAPMSARPTIAAQGEKKFRKPASPFTCDRKKTDPIHES